MPQTVPKRVSRTARLSPSAAQNVEPSAVAAWSGSASSDAARPAPAAASIAVRQRAANASEDAVQADSGRTSAARAGSHTIRSTIRPPTARAIAPNWIARTVANATDVTGPDPSPSSSSPTVTAAAPPLPTVKENPPETGCESAEMTR